MKKNLFIKISNQFLKLLFFPIIFIGGLIWGIRKIIKGEDFLVSQLYDYLDETFYFCKIVSLIVFHIFTLGIFINRNK